MVLSSYVRELALNVKDLLLMAPSVDPLGKLRGEILKAKGDFSK